MCGICGVYNLAGGERAWSTAVGTMNQTLYHRGPDEAGVYSGPGIALGISRLRIIDLAGGSQPMFSEDRSKVIVFNGEIYNYRELRVELQARGHRFTTNSDTESIVHLYEEHGADCLQYLNGMFAFAIWDEKAQTLFLARDRLGIKPLYYYEGSNYIAFASELKSLLAVGDIPREIDLSSLDKYLALRYIPSPHSIYRGVKKLAAGCYLSCSPGGVKVERYWDLAFPGRESNPVRSEQEYVEELGELLGDAVRMQLVSDVPLGVFLSGGIDSSSIVGLMAENHPTPIKTYSVGFKGWRDYDELKYARVVADVFGTEHREVVLEAKAGELLDHVVRSFDEPMADPAAIPTYLMSKVAREDVTVVLTGEGADEVFAGYGWYSWMQPHFLKGIPRSMPQGVRGPALGAVSTLMDGRRGKRTMMSSLLADFAERYFETIACSVFQRRERQAILSESVRSELGPGDYWLDFEYYLEYSRNFHSQDRAQYLDTKIWLEGDPLTKVDRMSMASSLEARVPFLDHRLVEFAAKIPPGLKRKGSVAKHVFREAMKGKLPNTILAREKQAFNVPIAEWLRTDLKDAVNALPEHQAISDAGLFSKGQVDKIVRSHLTGKRNYGPELWTLLNFAVWYATCFKSGS